MSQQHHFLQENNQSSQIDTTRTCSTQSLCSTTNKSKPKNKQHVLSKKEQQQQVPYTMTELTTRVAELTDHLNSLRGDQITNALDALSRTHDPCYDVYCADHRRDDNCYAKNILIKMNRLIPQVVATQAQVEELVLQNVINDSKLQQPGGNGNNNHNGESSGDSPDNITDAFQLALDLKLDLIITPTACKTVRSIPPLSFIYPHDEYTQCLKLERDSTSAYEFALYNAIARLNYNNSFEVKQGSFNPYGNGQPHHGKNKVIEDGCGWLVVQSRKCIALEKSCYSWLSRAFLKNATSDHENFWIKLDRDEMENDECKSYKLGNKVQTSRDEKSKSKFKITKEQVKAENELKGLENNPRVIRKETIQRLKDETQTKRIEQDQRDIEALTKQPTPQLVTKIALKKHQPDFDMIVDERNDINFATVLLYHAVRNGDSVKQLLADANQPDCGDAYGDYPIGNIIIAIWYKSRKEMNRIAHALNGNTEFMSSNLSTTSTNTLTTGVQSNTIILQNNTNNSIRWRDMEYGLEIDALGLPGVTVSLRYMLVITDHPTNIPNLLASNTAFQSDESRYNIGLYTTNTTTNSFGQVTLDLIKNAPQNMIVPIGYYVIGCVVTFGIAGLATWNINFRNANIRTAVTSPVPVVLHLPGNIRKTIRVATISDLEKYVMKIVPCKHRLTTKGGNKISSLYDHIDVMVKLPLLGGMDTGNITSVPNLADVTTSLTEIKEEKKEAKLSLSDAAALSYNQLRKSVDGHFDKNVVAVPYQQYYSRRSWFGLMKPQQVIQDGAGYNVYNDWYEDPVSTVRTNTGTATSPVMVTVPRYTITTPIIARIPSNTIAPAWAELHKALGGTEIVPISQLVRIDTTAVQGTAMLNEMTGTGKRFIRGQVGSMSEHLLKNLLYSDQLYFLPGSDSMSMACNNIHTKFQTVDPHNDATMFPLNVNVVARVDARIIDLSTFASIQAGGYTGNVIPAQWDRATWGVTTAVVPIDVSFTNNALGVAAWTLMFLEYPYNRWYHSATSVDDAGIPYPGVYNVYPASSNHRVPGVINQVLYVIVNVYPKGFANFIMTVGPLNLNLTLPANDIANGVSVDVSGTLTALFDVNYFQNGFDVARSWWYMFYSNLEDHTAAVLAASGSYYYGLSAKRFDAGALNSFYLWNSPSATPPGYYAPTLSTMPAPRVFDVAMSGTCVDSPIILDIDGVQNQNNPIRRIGTSDPSAAVAIMWQFIVYTNKVPANQELLTCVEVSTRLRFTARAYGSLVDDVINAMGFPMNEMLNLAIQSQRGNGILFDAWCRAYHVINMILESLQGNISLKYHINNISNTFSLPEYAIPDYGSPLLGGNYWVTSWSRKPWSSRHRYENDFQVPTNFVVPALSGIYYDIKSNTPGVIMNATDVELTNVQTDKQNDQLALTIRSVTSANWFTAGRTTYRTSRDLGMFLGNEKFDQVRGWAKNMLSPSRSINIYHAAVPYLRITLPDLVDPVWMDVFPTKDANTNQILQLGINAGYLLYANITRTNFVNYTELRYILSEQAIQTQQVTSSSKVTYAAAESIFGKVF